MTRNDTRSVNAALAALIVLQTIMLSALYAGIPPHPPVATPLFGLAPFIGAALAAAVAGLVLGTTETGYGRVLSLIAVVLAAVSFGPQKYFDAQFALIWPAVVVGQVAIVTVLVQVLPRLFRRSNVASQPA